MYKHLKIIIIIILLICSCYAENNQAISNHPLEITWEEVFSYSVTCFAINSKGHLFAGTWGVLWSQNNGDNWTLVDLPNTSSQTSSLAINSDDDIFATTNDGHIYRSEDDGKNWIQLHADSSNISFTCVDINSAGEIFIGINYGLVLSTNNGDKIEPTGWYDRSNPTKEIYRLAISPNDDIFIKSGGLYRSTDNGENWTSASSGLTNKGVNDFAFNSLNHVLVGTAAPNGGVFISINNGDNWTTTGYSFQNESDSVVCALFIDPADDIFVGTFGIGAVCSMDKGNSWTEINSGFPYDPTYGYPMVMSFICNAEGHILAATSSGIYRSEQPITSITEFSRNQSKSFLLNQNYPNPFNSTTTIGYRLSAVSDVDLSIYNLLGQKVATLVSEKQSMGTYKVEWDATGFASGVYLYKIQTDRGFSMAKKLVLLK